MRTANADMKILVVGAGFSGIVQCLLLDKLGFTDVTLLEKKSKLEVHGTPIVLAGVGRHVLESLLGINNILKEGETFEVKKLSIYSALDNSLIKESDIDWPDKEHLSLLMERQHLLNLLLPALKKTKVKLRLGSTLKQIQSDNDAVTVDINNQQETYDLLIDAGGFNSTVRNLVLGEKDFRENRMMWVVMGRLPLPDNNILAALADRLAVVYFSSTQESGAIIFTHANKKEQAKIQEATDETKKAYLLEKLERANVHPSYIDMVKSCPPIFTMSEQTIVLPHAYNKRVVFIGDAEHGLSPFTGMGTSLAFGDCVVLADSLATASNKNRSISQALLQYEQMRIGRISQVRHIAEKINKLVFKKIPFFNFILRRLSKKIPGSKLQGLTRQLYHDKKTLDYYKDFEIRHLLR